MRTHWHRMNVIHLVTALNNVAKCHNDDGSSPHPLCGRCTPNPPRVRQELLAKLKGTLPTMEGRTLSNVLWSLVKLEIEPEQEFLADFTAAILTKLETCTHHDLSQTLWTLATLGHTPPEGWFQRVDARTLATVPTFSTQVKGNIQHGFGNIRIG